MADLPHTVIIQKHVKDYWSVQIDRSIAITKMRIKHHEKHGCGYNVIKDKACLAKQERHRDLRNESK